MGRLAFKSADSQLLVTAGDDNLARLWEVGTGKLLQTFAGHTQSVLASIVGPENKTVLSCSVDGSVRVWDAAAGQQLKMLSHPDHVHGVVVSPDGKWIVTGCNDGKVRVWDFASGEEKKVLLGHTGKVFVAAFKRRRQMACYRLGRTETLGRRHVRQPLHTLPSPAHWLSFGPTGSVLACKTHHVPGESYTVSRWDIATGKKLPVLNLNNKGGWANFGLTADGKTLFAARAGAGPDPYVRAYDVQTGKGKALHRARGTSARYGPPRLAPMGTCWHPAAMIKPFAFGPWPAGARTQELPAAP